MVKISKLHEIIISETENLKRMIYPNLNINLEDEFLRACLTNVFRLELIQSFKYSEVTLKGLVEMVDGQPSIEQPIADYLSDSGHSKLKDSMEVAANYVMGHCRGLTFSTAYMARGVGTRIRIHRYHEPGNTPKNVSKLKMYIKSTALSGVIGGSVPALITTILSYMKIFSSKLPNIGQQTLMWGLWAISGAIAGSHYTQRVSKNPRKEYFRDRSYIGREIIVNNEISLSPEDKEMVPEQGDYRGKIASYTVMPQKIKRKKYHAPYLTLREWSNQNPEAPLFTVSLSASASHVIGFASLEMKIDEDFIRLSTMKSFTHTVNPAEIPGKGITFAENLEEIKNKSTFFYKPKY